MRTPTETTVRGRTGPRQRRALWVLHLVEVGGLAGLSGWWAVGLGQSRTGDGPALLVMLMALVACCRQAARVYRGATRLGPGGLALQSAVLVVALAALLWNPWVGAVGCLVSAGVLSAWGRAAARPDPSAPPTIGTELGPPERAIGREIGPNEVGWSEADLAGAAEQGSAVGERSRMGRAALVAGTASLILVALAVRPGIVVGLLVLAGLFIPLERWFPLHRRRVLRHRWRTDTVHYLVNGSLLVLGVLAVAVVLGLPLRALVPLGLRSAVASSPQWAQIVVALAVATVGGYAGHRQAHEVPLLWRFHRVHHSIRQMDWLAANHLNPLDEIFIRSCAVVPLVALGFGRVSLGAYLVLLTLQAVFIHANVRFTFGPVRWLVATPQFHHWHHARQPSAYNANYAGELPGVDLLFGTWYLPPAGQWPGHYGVADAEPDGYLRQVAWSFRAPCRPPTPGRPLD